MSRPLRITFPGAIYHMTSRGNAQAAIYADDVDRRAFLDLLTQIVQRYHLILIEAPPSTYHRGMLVVGKIPKKRRRPQAILHPTAPIVLWHRLARDPP